jgi:hypothetical protein
LHDGFRDDSLALVRRWLDEDAARSDVVVRDDVRLEVQGEGRADRVRFALGFEHAKLVLICVRASSRSNVFESFGLGDDPVAAIELPAEEGADEAFAAQLLAALPVGPAKAMARWASIALARPSSRRPLVGGGSWSLARSNAIRGSVALYVVSCSSG